MIRIYDQTVGQLAGVLVATTGKGNLTQDGLQAFAQAVTLVTGAGVPADFALESTQQDVLAALTTPAVYLPLPGLDTSSDTTVIHTTKNISSATTTEILAAVSSQNHRVYWLVLTCAAANVLTFKSAANAIFQVLTFPTAGGSFALDLTGYFWMKTVNGEALNLTTTTTAAVGLDIYTQTSA